ncbi:YggS family pyridoxal phosphate-dependent enzyme [Luteimonas sp. RD2P54]|uniref:Pyridoxal phosphate homeostasis protein n=1 Tax=Luteimonas endophytica TaxID=3042023 RepID=A0ABT6J9L4_9GAMM|nr:YggS family pyridoxal phosphate-dependent enzyme [Luteimonas endophytica]MDH5823503.1 YggS family pyridoxal phosphate-dependent enzyme [Luteimonas endophytica]
MPQHSAPGERLQAVALRIDNAASRADRPAPRLLAVGKTRDAGELAALLALRLAAGEARPAFGENYVQEAAGKIEALAGRPVEWHLIGHLQSNKARQAAALFDWVQTLDRPKLVAALARHRPAERGPLNVLVQVNIDDEDSKQGCRPEDVPALADAVAAEPRLALRGLMAIPAPHPEPSRRRAAFARMRAAFEALAARYPQVDTLSMGMSDDLEEAIAEGATMVRVGTALFGPRPAAGARTGGE